MTCVGSALKMRRRKCGEQMASLFYLVSAKRTFGLAALLAGVSTAALAQNAQPDPRDARIQQLQNQVQQLLAEDQRLAAKTQQLESAITALQQGQAAQAQAGQPEAIQTLPPGQ